MNYKERKELEKIIGEIFFNLKMLPKFDIIPEVFIKILYSITNEKIPIFEMKTIDTDVGIKIKTDVPKNIEDYEIVIDILSNMSQKELLLKE